MVNPRSPEKVPNQDFSVDALHRELIEARNLAIKTDNLVKNLGAEIKQIARHQAVYQRKYLFNSAIAYVLFVGVIFTGLYLAFNAKLSAARREVEHYTERNRLLQDSLDQVEAELQRRRESEEQANAFFEILQSGNYDEIVERFNQISSQLTDRVVIELFQDRVDEITYSLAEEAFRTGMTRIQSEDWTEARDSFMRSLSHVELAPWTPVLQFNLGVALFETGDFEGAVEYFDRALASDSLDDGLRAGAQYRRAVCLENTGRISEAVDAYELFRSNYPDNRFAGRALHSINRLARDLEHQTQE
jgi:tetratricopeptide (TPR) repeat protein